MTPIRKPSQDTGSQSIESRQPQLRPGGIIWRGLDLMKTSLYIETSDLTIINYG